MHRSPLVAVVPLLLLGASSASAQASTDTMPATVVQRMLDAFDRGDRTTQSQFYDSLSYFEDLAVPPPGDPRRPHAMSAAERARQWQASANDSRGDTLPSRSRKILERMVVGRFVVYHIAVVFAPPHEDRSFEKLEVYEVKNGKVVAEYDGVYTASGRSVATHAP